MQLNLKINGYRYMYTSIGEGRGSKHRGSTATSSLCLASNNCCCHPADGVFNTNILLSHALSKILAEVVIVCATPRSWTGLLPRNFKTTKIDFSQKLAPPKITRHTTRVVMNASTVESCNYVPGLHFWLKFLLYMYIHVHM